MVLITVKALRADVLSGWGGPPGLTPHLEALSRRVTWSGRAIASSPDAAPSLASVLTGLEPRDHGVWDSSDRLPTALLTLPEAFKQAGYSTVVFRDLPRKQGWEQGIERYRATARLIRAKEHLSGLAAAPSFTWIHIEELGATWPRQDRFLRRLKRPPPLPVRWTAKERARLWAQGLTELERQQAWALYSLNVAALDESLGGLIAAFEASGQWHRSTFVVLATQGLEIGSGLSGGLSRPALEVPLLVKVPGSPAVVAPRTGDVVPLARVFSTILESSGVGPGPAAAAPGLFSAAAAGALSVVWREDHGFTFSWIEDEYQLLQDSPLAATSAAAELWQWSGANHQVLADDRRKAAMAAAMEAEYFFFAPRPAWTGRRDRDVPERRSRRQRVIEQLPPT